MKGNRQGSLSRSITRRSDQNRKIKYCFYFAILPQLVKKVRSDFFDKLNAALQKSAALFFFGGGYAPVGRTPCVPPPGTHFSAGHAGPALRDGMLNRVSGTASPTIFARENGDAYASG